MKRSLACVAFLVASAWLIAGASPASAAGITKDELDAVNKKLEANGQQWATNEPLTDKPDMGKVQFDKDSVAALDAILKSAKKETPDLYAVNKLLERVETADAETIRAILPAVKALHARVHTTYRTFPQINKAQADSLKMGSYGTGLSTEAMMARMAALEKSRDSKVEKEQPIAKYNEMAYEVEKHGYRMMLLADDPKEDMQLVRALFAEEKAGRAMFFSIANDMFAVAKDKKRMSEDRARKLYPQIRPNIPRIGMQPKKSYVNPGQCILHMDETSTPGKLEAYAGILCIQLMNQIAEAANDKAMASLKVPEPKDVDEAAKKAAGGK